MYCVYVWVYVCACIYPFVSLCVYACVYLYSELNTNLSLWNVVLIEMQEGCLESGRMVLAGCDSFQAHTADVESLTKPRRIFSHTLIQQHAAIRKHNVTVLIPFFNELRG